MSSLQGIFFDVHPENWGDDEIWTKKLFFDDFPNPSWSVVHPPMFVAGILQDHPNQHQVCSISSCWGVFHRCFFLLATPVKPEAQKVVYKVKQNPARRTVSRNRMVVQPCHPKKPPKQSTYKKWMVGRWSFPVLFCCCLFSGAWTAVSFREGSRPYERGIIEGQSPSNGFFFIPPIGFSRVYDGLIGVYEPRRANFAMIP